VRATGKLPPGEPRATLDLAMPSTQDRECSGSLEAARASVLEWLRAHQHDPALFESGSAREGEDADGKIVEMFMNCVLPEGFDFTIHEVSDHEAAGFVVHWTHRGSGFIGFRQPPPGHTPLTAKLLACAALLRNDWCRGRLP
jgi:hypothetical protein